MKSIEEIGPPDCLFFESESRGQIPQSNLRRTPASSPLSEHSAPTRLMAPVCVSARLSATVGGLRSATLPSPATPHESADSPKLINAERVLPSVASLSRRRPRGTRERRRTTTACSLLSCSLLCDLTDPALPLLLSPVHVCMLRSAFVRRAPSSLRPPLFAVRAMSFDPAEATMAAANQTSTAAGAASMSSATSSSPRRKVSSCSSGNAVRPSYPGLSGVFSVYKPRGVTSRDVVNAAAALLSAGPHAADGAAAPLPPQRFRLKMGHGGTLDKAAEGVVILAAAAGTKLLPDCLAGHKAYVASAILGADTDSHDTDDSAQITRQADYAHVTREAMETYLATHYAAMGGTVQQTPPLYSALKQDGQRLSEHARSGHAAEVDLESKARPVAVESITLLSFDPPRYSLECKVGGGFYVRALIRDIGQYFRCGSVMTRLVRTEQHGFSTQSPLCIDMSDERLYRRTKKESAGSSHSSSERGADATGSNGSRDPQSKLAAVLAASGVVAGPHLSRPTTLLPFSKENVVRVLAVPLAGRQERATGPSATASAHGSLPARMIAAAAAAVAGASLAVAAAPADSSAASSAGSSSSSPPPTSSPLPPSSPAAAAESILSFWFFAPTDPRYCSTRMEWFKKDPVFDAEIRSRFGPLIDEALRGGLREWREGPSATTQTRLALLLLLDQFTRNTFRGSPKSFAGDALALSIAREMVSSGEDRSLHPRQRMFVTLPFQHSESLSMQDESIRLCTQLRDDMGDGKGGDEMLDYARRHRDIIARFGRFPHRNEVLGRKSTAEEIEFLKQPGSSF